MWIFQPIYKQTIWGGHRIHRFMGLPDTEEAIGESWCLSAVPGSESTVTEGPDKGLTISGLIKKYKSALMGKRNYATYGEKFPLLLKFIDAQDDLSVQVHPNDEMARRYGMPYGKTEMWYVIDAIPGSRLANGFMTPVDPDRYESLIESGEIENKLQFINISKGDAFFIPAGSVHTIGKGALLAEIQQSSDATYRIYDYHRKDKNGNERQLHTELAKEAINFNNTSHDKIVARKIEEGVSCLTDSEYFKTNLIKSDTPLTRDYSSLDSFVILMVTAGAVSVECDGEQRRLSCGQTILIPASATSVTLHPDPETELLETYC